MSFLVSPTARPRRPLKMRRGNRGRPGAPKFGGGWERAGDREGVQLGRQSTGTESGDVPESTGVPRSGVES